MFGQISGNHSYLNYDNYYARVKISGCENSGDVSGTDCVGGILGNAATLVNELRLCKSTGSVSGSMYVGGFAGSADGVAMYSLANGNSVTGKAYLGGIAGIAGKVESCTNNGTLISVGFYTNTDGVSFSYVGGIAGYATGAVDCVNNKDLNVENGGRYVGGIVASSTVAICSSGRVP